MSTLTNRRPITMNTSSPSESVATPPPHPAPRGFTRRRRNASHHPFVGRFLLALAPLLLSGCATFQSQQNEYEEWLALELRPASSQLRPGEAMVVEAELRNLSGRELEARALNADSVRFTLLNQTTGESLSRRAVASPREDLTVVEPLAPNGVAQRLFLFTDATETSGAFALQGIYTTPIERDNVSPMAISPGAAYTVAGERRFSRGPDGLISRDDAIGLAQAELDRPTVDAQAVLIQNEAGFLDWRVRLTLAPETLEENEAPEVGFLVNPYLGQVRARTRTDIARQQREPSAR